ncbi:large ribosomal subunit protein bL21m isoform X1 [Phascolarctos cinereus]|uniref:Large ribosomal subunit protein bL21m n=1 Tax=Phascolarctos cinereus TaxID=38626 RepID=A0A6P5IZR4_PHACI|nr:39S ribosomal protein L21, mitochondrial isoform X1 [Phascolarctos cinereus]
MAAAAAAARAAVGALVRRRLFPAAGGLRFPASPGAAAGLGANPGTVHLWPAFQSHSSQSTSAQERVLPKMSLTSPPWPKVVLPDPKQETRHHQEVLQRVNELIATRQHGRLFAVVHFASRQWKVTDGDLILIENTLEARCGERIRMEKVLLVGADDFTLIGKPLLGLDLVRVEATVIEKTESWPRVYMKFKKRKNFRKKKIFIRPQTILRINTVEIAPSLS